MTVPSPRDAENLAANYIGGEWRRGSAGSPVPIANPATAETLARVALAEAADVAAAVSAASAAFPGWHLCHPLEHPAPLARMLTQSAAGRYWSLGGAGLPFGARRRRRA